MQQSGGQPDPFVPGVVFLDIIVTELRELPARYGFLGDMILSGERCQLRRATAAIAGLPVAA
ncbi:hypothetical protein [Micromonospora pallida]|uniref:hypothetical protein n=1 Tax=Micromonospora pallida TaxID=145854 RepID=UPI00114CE523|nr:hypothetical protein [Micromonospora pallida]